MFHVRCLNLEDINELTQRSSGGFEMLFGRYITPPSFFYDSQKGKLTSSLLRISAVSTVPIDE